MSEYLDKTGLAYFWGKIKGKFNTISEKIDTKTNSIDFAPANNPDIAGIIQLYNPDKFRELGGTAPDALGGRIICYGQRRPWNDRSYGDGYYLYLTSNQKLYFGTLISTETTITWKQIA